MCYNIIEKWEWLWDEALHSQREREVIFTVVFLLLVQGSVIAESVLASAVSDADFVFEAVIEDVQVKKKLFQGTEISPCVWQTRVEC